MQSKRSWHGPALAVLFGVTAALGLTLTPANGQGEKAKVAESVRLAEKKRVEVINKVSPSVVAVMARDPRGNLVGNGSGVLITDDGFALTNWHVTSAARSPLLKCGLPDGEIYDAVLVGLDKVGDVALIKLLPKEKVKGPDGKLVDKPFPFAPLGDSDLVRAGDWSLAMGNPFSLATDFTPTVTFGLISGVHRYQYPAGTLLEYTDCIQIDTSINPGNSGGPLFNMAGELIGINGRGSFEKRGRVNSGVGYAISINQIKNFLGHLMVGLDSDHASLGAAMESESEDGGINRILVRSIIESDARRRGLDVGAQLISFGGRPMTTVNQFKNVLGLYPRGWRVPLVFRMRNDRIEVLVRLMGVQRGVINDGPTGAPPPPGPGPNPNPGPGPLPNVPSRAFFKNKTGYANYYFNEKAQERIMSGLASTGDFAKLNGEWTFHMTGKRLSREDGDREVKARFNLSPGGDKGPKILVDIDRVQWDLQPVNVDEDAEKFLDPPGTNGLGLAMYLYRTFLQLGKDGYKESGVTEKRLRPQDFHHGGTEPFYPPTKDDKEDVVKTRVLAEVIRNKFAGWECRWYFAATDDAAKRWKKGEMIGFEVTANKEKDPCEVCLSDYKDFNGRRLPSRFFIRSGGAPYADFRLDAAQLQEK